MKETDLQIQSTPPNFELSLDSDEVRIIIADYEQKLEKLKSLNAQLVRERDVRILPSFYFLTIAVMGLLAMITILINRADGYHQGYIDGRENNFEQLEKLKQTYCLEKHQSSSAYRACLESL